jgi:Ca2+/Na+ antiporter
MKTNEKRLIAALTTFFVYFLVCIWVIGTEELTMKERAGIALCGMFFVFTSMTFPFENFESDSNQDDLV